MWLSVAGWVDWDQQNWQVELWLWTTDWLLHLRSVSISHRYTKAPQMKRKGELKAWKDESKFKRQTHNPKDHKQTAQKTLIEKKKKRSHNPKCCTHADSTGTNKNVYIEPKLKRGTKNKIKCGINTKTALKRDKVLWEKKKKKKQV